MRSTVIIFLSTLVFISIFSGCSIFDNDIQIEKRMALYFETESLGDTLSSGEDYVVITDFKFSVDRFIVSGEEIELESSPDVSTFLFTYDLNAANERLVIDVGLGVADNFTFNSYSMFLEPVKDNAPIIDDDFFGEEKNYSLIIKGSFKNKNFDLKFSPTLQKSFTFTPVSLSDEDETLLLKKSIDLKDIFVNPDGTILNPTDSTSSSIIKERMITFLDMQAFAINNL
ncbi:MAG: hypothetical protein HUJ22_07430 [Gracilimonas sp.]|uniref:hypothetical protein n=1 Tax=Gracilimonas sp. TaxID=1974203 RepID=UPI0019CED42E|nr:hypothetical protein [Gracilimonas sp.]MBD3616388.1 hypothetical protein [Gracilimonas sp.]